MYPQYSEFRQLSFDDLPTQAVGARRERAETVILHASPTSGTIYAQAGHVMIDWVTCVLPLKHTLTAINGGCVVAIDRYGAREWKTDRRLPVVGSFSALVHVRTKGLGLELSGNPAKWLQGHNLFGSSDLLGLVYHTGIGVCEALGLRVALDDLWDWAAGRYPLSRVDVTRMFALESREQVQRWLVAVGQIAHGRHQKVSQYDGQTVYLGKHSRRATLKAYCKGDELRAHPLPGDLPKLDKLREYADNKLRVELSLRSMALKDRGLDQASAWSGVGKPTRVLGEYIAKLEVSDTMVIQDDVAAALPDNLQGVYHRWRAGVDLRASMSRSAFYRWRSKLLPYGVDIAIVRPRVVQAETQYLLGAPLKSFIEGPGEAPPKWAKRAGLLAG